MSTPLPVARGPRGWVGWRFGHPDLDAGTPGIAIAASGRVELVRDADAVRQALILLLSTRPGERVMRPDYGCELPRLLFAPNDDTTAGLAIHYVRRAVERFEPRAIIVSIDAGPSPLRPDRLDVVLDYRPRLGGPTETLTVTVPLQEGV